MDRPRQKSDTEQGDGSPATLGDVLYASEGKPLVYEQEWVALVHATAAADEVALHALYERAHRPVYTLLMRMTANHETAEELTLDVFHDVWRRASSYDPANGTVLGWIMNQARSRGIDRLRYDQRKKRSGSGAEDLGAAAPAPDPADVLALKQQSEALRGALEILTPAEREAIESAFFAELTYAEVAARTGAPLGTIKTRIRSGLRKLRESFIEGPQ